MFELIGWLRGMEGLACDVYVQCADVLPAESKLSRFFSSLADDETLHYHIMGSALETIRNHPDLPTMPILVDDEMRRRIEDVFQECLNQLAEGTLTESDAVRFLIQAESLEWNDIFHYVLTECQELSKTFQRIASTIQRHEERIEKFINGLPTSITQDSAPFSLHRRIWNRKILVVEDHKAMRVLYARLLSRIGEVTAVTNGKEALECVGTTFYDVMIVDFDMPALNGMELYEAGVEQDSDFTNRFIMCSGVQTTQLEEFCEAKSIPLLRKPVMLTLLLKHVTAACEA